MQSTFTTIEVMFVCTAYTEGILSDGNPEVVEPDGPVRVCVRLQGGVTTAIDIPVVFNPQAKPNSTNPATRMLFSGYCCVCIKYKLVVKKR